MPHKNTRKLVRIGNDSFGIIIPRAWLRYNELGYGDCLEVITNEKIIIQKREK